MGRMSQGRGLSGCSRREPRGDRPRRARCGPGGTLPVACQGVAACLAKARRATPHEPLRVGQKGVEW